MIKASYKIFSSMYLALALLAIFAISCAVGTFIENDFDRESAYVLIYDTWWFELLMVLLSLSILLNIIKYHMYKKNKWFILLFHLSFVVIGIGAFLTRYFGYEATLHIREGQHSNKMLTQKAYLHIKATKIKNKKILINKKIPLSVSKTGHNDFSYDLKLDNKQNLSIKYNSYISKAIKQIMPAKDGVAMIDMKISSQSWVKDIQFERTRPLNFGNMVFVLNSDWKSIKDYVKFNLKDEKFYFISNQDIDWLRMSDQKKGVFKKNITHELLKRHLYTVKDINFVPRAFYANAKVETIEDYTQSLEVNGKDTTSKGALVVDVDYKTYNKKIALLGKGKASKGTREFFRLDDINIELEWGSDVIELPFNVRLDDFILDRYLGSQSPSSYMSKISIISDNKKILGSKVYMNNVLDYGGLRFFQASYDKDEKGSILSVNKDPGKIPTYIGYFMLILGLIVAIIHPKSRFRKLIK